MREWTREKYEESCRLADVERMARDTQHLLLGAIVKQENDAMKKCPTCGERFRLKVGEIVETTAAIRTPLVGMVTDIAKTGLITVQGFNGDKRGFAQYALVRCHGYYRITEREPLS